MTLLPTCTGPLQMLAICRVQHAAAPAALLLAAQVRSLCVSYSLEDAEGRPVQQPWQQQEAQRQQHLERVASHASASCSSAAPPGAGSSGSRDSRPCSAAPAAGLGPPAAQQHPYLEVNFGLDVPIGHSRQLQLRLTNQTAMRADVSAWFEHFGADALQEPLAAGVRSTRKLSASRRPGSPSARPASGSAAEPPAAAAEAAVPPGSPTQQQQQQQAAPAPIRLSCAHERTQPFRSEAGRAMVARQAAAQEGRAVLGGKGLGLAVSPPCAVLEPWGSLVLRLACHNDMCGSYVDELCVQVGAGKGEPALRAVHGCLRALQAPQVGRQHGCWWRC